MALTHFLSLSSTDLWSAFIATLSAFVAFDAVHRVRCDDRAASISWAIAGSLAVAAGLWSMEVGNLQSYGLVTHGDHRTWLIVVALVAAFAVAATALQTTARTTATAKTRSWPVGNALLVGFGLCTLQFAGLAATGWSLPLPALAVRAGVFLVVASIAALAWLRTLSRLTALGVRSAPALQCAAAFIIGVGMLALHRAGLVAAGVSAVTSADDGSRATDLLSIGNVGSVAMVSALAAIVLLSYSLLASFMEGGLRRRSALLAASLDRAHVHLASADDAIRRAAIQDSLTKVLNRMAFEERLAQRLDSLASGEDDRRLAVLFVDINGLRAVNDALSHSAGDDLIRQVASRIDDEVRDGDVVGRFSGDRFTILMDGVDGAADCVDLSNRIVEAVRSPFDVAGRKVQAGICIGIALQGHGGAGQDLILESDAAVQAAKASGSGGHAFFESHMQQKLSEEFDLVADLRIAIEYGHLELHYQPKIDVLEGTLAGVEALLRWTHPTRGAIGPALFVPLAERFGLIGSLGNWVITKACAQLGKWQRDGIGLRVAINLSAHQLREPDLVRRIRAALDHEGVDPSQLLCEITESVAMQDVEATQRTLEALRQTGIYLSIDDFGTGYSSLSYLRQLPAKQLKIDRCFVNDLETSSDARALVDAIVRLAHALDLRVVAEGVETLAQRDILIGLGCDELQGFLFGRPMSAVRLLEWTKGDKPADVMDFSRSLVLDPL